MREEGEERRVLQREGDDELDRVMKAIEGVGTRLLTTASGVGFTLGAVYALRRR